MLKHKENLISTELRLAWLMVASMVALQILYIVVCYVAGAQIQHPIDVAQRMMLRSVFYALAIGVFPLTTLIRHIFVRLNQTMPGEKTATQRYLGSVIVSQVLMESVGVMGFLMFIFGDDFNTLYIFSGLAILGFFLQRPKQDELQSIEDALASRGD